MKEIRVLILVQNRLFRESLCLAISQFRTFRVVASPSELDDIEKIHESIQPEILVLSFQQVNHGGLAQVQGIRRLSRSSKILIIDVPGAEHDIVACVKAGCAGYVIEDMSLEDFINAIKTLVAEDKIYVPRFDELVLPRILSETVHGHPKSQPALVRLTLREQQIAQLISTKQSNKEIAVELDLQLQTVKNHVHSILSKLQLNGRKDVAKALNEFPETIRMH